MKSRTGNTRPANRLLVLVLCAECLAEGLAHGVSLFALNIDVLCRAAMIHGVVILAAGNITANALYMFAAAIFMLVHLCILRKICFLLIS